MTPLDATELMDRLMSDLGHRFSTPMLLLEALTHRSFVNESQDPTVRDNERFEFLGDAVIDLVVSTALMTRHPMAREGALSKMRAAIVNEAGLARVARALRLGECLRLGRGEEISGGRDRSSLLADAFEAVIAAVYLDAGFERVREVLLRHLQFPDDLERPRGDPKTEVQERIQAKLRRTPTYRVIAEDGPDHSKTFQVEILLGDEVMAEGTGRTKKEAEQRAAANLLAALDREGTAPPG
jgi:ribonuclease-3